MWAIKDHASANLEKDNSLFFRLITDSLPHLILNQNTFFNVKKKYFHITSILNFHQILNSIPVFLIKTRYLISFG